MKESYKRKIIFARRKREWYSALVTLMKGKYKVSDLIVSYFFEQKHVSKLNVMIDSIVLFLIFPLYYLKEGRGLYILTTRHLPMLFWFKIMSLFGLKQRVIAMNFFFHIMRNNNIVKIILRFLISNKNLTIIVPSRNDYDYFYSLSQTMELHYVIFGMGKSEMEYEVKDGDYIFCGGYGNRDFDIVFDVAKEINEKFHVITSRRVKYNRALSSNVERLYDVDLTKFHSSLARAKIVIIPLKGDYGAAGQMVTLFAMLQGKPIIYTDYNVISEYFIDGVNGLSYKARDRQDLKAKIEKLLKDDEYRKELGRNAKKYSEENFTIETTNRKIVAIVSEIFNS